MKINNALLVLACGVLLSACSRSGEMKIAVKDSEKEYQFSAHFDEKKSIRVKRVIDANIAPTRVADQDDAAEVTTILDDRTKFDLRYDPGDVLVRLNKNENSTASYTRIKKMCEEIKEVMEEK